MLGKVHFQGFSLIQVSISLLIIGIISAIGLSQLSLIQKVYATQKTQANIDFIIKTLGLYCSINEQQLPYPSKINSDIGLQSESMKNSFGIIPFKSLGIMEKSAKDGNGRWLLYKMNAKFCKPKSGKSGTKLPDRYDDLAFIIKSQNVKNEDEILISYNETTLLALVAKFSRIYDTL